eukprot:12664409-Alexandrium_andersonii.AAC.1
MPAWAARAWRSQRPWLSRSWQGPSQHMQPGPPRPQCPRTPARPMPRSGSAQGPGRSEAQRADEAW